MKSRFKMGLLEGFLPVEMGKKTEEIHTTEAGSYQGQKTNDRQQRSNGVHCNLNPLSTSISVWAKVKR